MPQRSDSHADRKLLLLADSLLPGNGGICRVARLIAKVIATKPFGAAAGALVLRDPDPPEDPLPGRTAGGSRLKFVMGANLAAATHTHFIYDFLGLARAHGKLPFLRRPFLTYIHGVEVWDTPAASTKRIAAARRAGMLLANSRYTRERANEMHGGFEGAKVCWLGTEEDEPPRASRSTSAPPRALIVSRLGSDAYKGHAELIACWPKVVSSVPDARLTIVGTGHRLEDFRRQAAASPVADKIELPGFVSDQEMARIWAETSVFAMPSRGEGFGLVYIEAMRYGVPVIASIHDAAQEINLDGVTGYNVDMDKPAELPERLVQLLRDRDQGRRMGGAGFLRWSEHFHFSAFRQRFLPFLESFLAM